MKRLDHLVLGVPDLAAGARWAAERLGVEPAPGGRHPRWGTANALLGLGGERYLEVMGPDPEREPDEGPVLFGLDRLPGPRLVTWAARGAGLEALARRARAAGVPLGEVSAGRRTKPDGTELAWRLSDPAALPADGLVPFFIDWGDTPHAGLSAPAVGELVELRGEHPEPTRVRAMLSALDLHLPVELAEVPALVARIRTAGGREVELR